MADDILPVAIIGVGGVGRMTLQACLDSPLVRLAGVADQDGAVAEQAGRQAGVPFYRDNRRLLAEVRPRAVFLAAPPAAAPEILSACAERGIHVWKELPLARNLAEGVAFVRRMQDAGLKLAVGTQRRFALGYRELPRLAPRIAEVFLVRAHYLFNWGQPLGWRGDRASAGGGALLELAYHLIDVLVRLLGLPDEVYGQCVSGHRPDHAPDSPRPPYDTEDTAAVILEYARGPVASVLTTRSSGPVSEEMFLHGRKGSVFANGETFLLRDPDGNVIDRGADDPSPLAVFRRQVDAFASAVLSDAPRYECSGWENLLNQAVIEAIYLSDRTSQPETPSRVLKNCGLTGETCLQARPLQAPATAAAAGAASSSGAPAAQASAGASPPTAAEPPGPTNLSGKA